MYPALVPEKSTARYEPKCFGFKVHAPAALQRWQDNHREQLKARLKGAGVEGPIFAEDQDDPEDMEEDELEADDGGEL